MRKRAGPHLARLERAVAVAEWHLAGAVAEERSARKGQQVQRATRLLLEAQDRLQAAALAEREIALLERRLAVEDERLALLRLRRGREEDDLKAAGRERKKRPATPEELQRVLDELYGLSPEVATATAGGAGPSA
jgi:hypothetical protein